MSPDHMIFESLCRQYVGNRVEVLTGEPEDMRMYEGIWIGKNDTGMFIKPDNQRIMYIEFDDIAVLQLAV
ncbi:hypothetical protein [Ectobacillus ponti]|uniref:Uncharacterized protein n=1 Tax=Ectobacillus ponti TaxID=2961894 RepID=A0AA41X936_9BACI|nr:hypothetical protein [Ectobacillus ponti]MCP8968959.1 hypothetical protein [Ectobacillus ponti]